MKQAVDVPTNENSVEKLQFFSFFIDLDKIACVYKREKTPETKRALAKIYQDLTGDNIENKLTLSEQLNCKKI